MSDIREGYALAPHGRGQEQAKAALAAVEAAGLAANTVKTHPQGYLIPVEAVDFYEGGDIEVRAEAVPEGTEITEENAAVATTPDGTEVTGELSAASEQHGDDGDDSIPGTRTDAQVADDEPSKAASTEVWAQWAAKNKGYDVSEDLSRAQLIERYAAPAAG